MKLLPESLQQEAALALTTAAWVLWYLDTRVLPTVLREHKYHAVWNAATKRYHESLWRFNYSADRQLRYSAVSKNMVLEHLEHTKPKQIRDHVDHMIAANKKIYDAFNANSKRVMIWQTTPSLQ